MARKAAYVLDEKHHQQSAVTIPGVGLFEPGVPVAASDLQIDSRDLDELIAAGSVPLKRTHAEVPDEPVTSEPENPHPETATTEGATE